MLCLFVDIVDTKIKAINALNAMFVDKLILVFVVFTQHCILQEERLLYCALCLVGLAVHQSVQEGSFVNFLGLVNYKGDYRQGT